jgi:hypothetical protein
MPWVKTLYEFDKLFTQQESASRKRLSVAVIEQKQYDRRDMYDYFQLHSIQSKCITKTYVVSYLFNAIETFIFANPI